MMRTKKHSICFVCKLFEGVAFLIISISNNARVLITAAFYGLFTATLGASQQNAIISIDWLLILVAVVVGHTQHGQALKHNETERMLDEEWALNYHGPEL